MTLQQSIAAVAAMHRLGGPVQVSVRTKDAHKAVRTLDEAFATPGATVIAIDGKQVFRFRKGQWIYVEKLHVK